MLRMPPSRGCSFTIERCNRRYDPIFRMTKLVLEIGFLGIVVALTLGCSRANVETEQKWLNFRCPDGQVVMAQFQPQDQFVNVRFAGREMRLPHVISGSGARYSDGKTTFWNRGRSVFVEVDDKIVVQDCMLQGEPQG